jgi:hypothetical protein
MVHAGRVWPARPVASSVRHVRLACGPRPGLVACGRQLGAGVEGAPALRSVPQLPPPSSPLPSSLPTPPPPEADVRLACGSRLRLVACVRGAGQRFGNQEGRCDGGGRGG